MFLLFAFACAHSVTATVVLPETDSHYLVMEDAETLWDCRSMPSGHKWKPTCVKVTFKSQAPDDE